MRKARRLASSSSSIAAATRTILLVEDEAVVRMVTVDVLCDCGFRVETAASASEALAKVGLLGGGIAAAIIDIGLPDRPGDALAVELRAQLAHLPIVIASGYGDGIDAGLAGDALVRFLGKPYGSEQLSGLLGELGVRPRA